MPDVQHTASYYAATRNDTAARHSLHEKIKTDICVIGAGFTGISSALHLAEAGYNVVVLEAARIGFGASGRNGGQIVNSYSRDMDVIEKNYGSDFANALGSMAFEGSDIIRQRIETYGIDCAYLPGGIFAALTKKQLQELEARKRLWERFGHSELVLLDNSAIKTEIQSARYVGGLLDKRGGHLHPLNLLLGEVTAFESLGGLVFEQSPVVQIERKSRPVVRTSLGEVECQYVIVAGNAYLKNLVPELAEKSMPCGTQIITTEVLDSAVARQLIPNSYCVEDCNYKLDYYRLTADGRLLFGGGVTYGGGDPSSIEKFLRKHLEKTFPQLQGIQFDFAWGGDFLLTMSRLPQFGRLTPQIYYAQGYSGHGVTTTHLAGKLIAEAIQQQAERFDVFASLRHLPFPGGQKFRVPYTAMGALYYGLRDKIGW